ncbi:MAG TPA: hypothetical protein PLP42_00225 [Acidobacteriota bacterium]|nr:hypothetical protein [Acidobacteriota bacterium]
MSLVDIHTHLIPGIDDGATCLDDTLEMLRIAHQSGTRRIVATPHMFLDGFQKNTILLVNDRFAETQSALKDYSLRPEFAFVRDMEVVLGAENYVSIEFLEALAQGCVVPINGGRYLLLESSPFLPMNKFEVALRRVLTAGYTPVIAHVERIIAVQEIPARLENFARLGCLFQVNADTFLDTASSRLRKTGLALADLGFIHVVASDGHRPRRRPPALQETYQLLQQKFPPRNVRAWMIDNPGRIIDNLPVTSA